MKLSAPPPPPPEPNDSQPPAAADAPAPEPVEPPAAATPAPPKALAWPAWFAAADVLLAVVVVVLAFMAGSFVARNSDVWLHLAAGQRLLAGQYSPGSDPFSFSAADRTWVNHSILFDAAFYLLYSGNGMLLVVLKALAAAAAVGLMIALRRPGFSLWPWAALGLVAVLAAAPYLHLRPYTASFVLFALTLFLLFRGGYRPGSWAFPAAVGVTFWVWANVDEWFFLGPLAVALVLVGELIQRATSGPAGDAAAGEPLAAPAGDAVVDEPLAAPPDVSALAKALGVGLVACMLNPHHVGVWQLPVELTGARELLVDMRFRQVMLTPLDPLYRESKELGYNQNGLAFAVLFVAGGAALGLAGGRLRLSHLLLWVGFALLSLQSILLIPFVALLAIPLVASQLNALSARATLTTWGDPKSRLLLLGSGFGRVVVLVVALVACVAAWPGWVHPPVSNEAYARRVAWAVEPDEGMARGVRQLQAWRSGESPRLSPESRGLILSLEFANYCAWFAPAEKVYANARYRHHLRELRPYTEVRKGLDLLEVPAEMRPRPEELADTLTGIGAEYVVTHAGPGDNTFFRARARISSMNQWVNRDRWSPWYIDGRSSVCGWRSGPGAEKPTFAGLRLDPVVLAFGPGVEKLPRGEVVPAVRW
ncbi:MAG TPA: hypothetical protein VM529_16150, partial [Gemmata sp.]|nr:hypothetical protein [Gemmata sp.]